MRFADIDVFDIVVSFFFFQAEDGIRDLTVTGVQTCALPILACTEEPDASVGPACHLATELAAELSAVHRARGLRQAEVAARMGTAQSCVSDFERSKSNPGLDFIARYAAAVGADLRVEVASRTEAEPT